MESAGDEFLLPSVLELTSTRQASPRNWERLIPRLTGAIAEPDHAKIHSSAVSDYLVAVRQMPYIDHGRYTADAYRAMGMIPNTIIARRTRLCSGVMQRRLTTNLPPCSRGDVWDPSPHIYPSDPTHRARTPSPRVVTTTTGL